MAKKKKTIRGAKILTYPFSNHKRLKEVVIDNDEKSHARTLQT